MNARRAAALGLLLPLALSVAPTAGAAGTGKRPCGTSFGKGSVPRLTAQNAAITSGIVTGACNVKKYTFTVTLQQYRGLGFWANKASTTAKVTNGSITTAMATWRCGKGTGTQTYRVVTDYKIGRQDIAGPASPEKRITCG